MRQKVAERHDAIACKDNLRVHVSGIDLQHQFTAASAGRDDGLAAHRHGNQQTRLASLERLRNGGMLGTVPYSCSTVYRSPALLPLRGNLGDCLGPEKLWRRMLGNGRYCIHFARRRLDGQSHCTIRQLPYWSLSGQLGSSVRTSIARGGRNCESAPWHDHSCEPIP